MTEETDTMGQAARITPFPQPQATPQKAALSPWKDDEFIAIVIQEAGIDAMGAYTLLGTWLNRDTLSWSPSLADMCQRGHTTLPTLRKRLKALEDHGFITVDRTVTPHCYTAVKQVDWYKKSQEEQQKVHEIYTDDCKDFATCNNFDGKESFNMQNSFTSGVKNFSVSTKPDNNQDVPVVSDETTGRAASASPPASLEKSKAPKAVAPPPQKPVSLDAHFAAAKRKDREEKRHDHAHYKRHALATLKKGLHGHGAQAILAYLARDLLGKECIPKMDASYRRFAKMARELDSIHAVAEGIFATAQKKDGADGLGGDAYRFIDMCARRWLLDQGDDRGRVKPPPPERQRGCAGCAGAGVLADTNHATGGTIYVPCPDCQEGA